MSGQEQGARGDAHRAPRIPRMGAHVIVSEAELSAYKGFYFVVGMLAGAIISNAIAWIVYVLVTSGMVSK